MEEPEPYVICCRCGEPDEGHLVGNLRYRHREWWLWCLVCQRQMRSYAVNREAPHV